MLYRTIRHNTSQGAKAGWLGLNVVGLPLLAEKAKDKIQRVWFVGHGKHMIMKNELHEYICMWCGKMYDNPPQDGECSRCHQKKLRKGNIVVANQHSSLLIKISSEKVLKSMRNGSLWFQSPKYFREYSGDGQTVRTDIHEARYSYIDKQHGYVEDSNANAYRILCFYSLDVNANGDFLNAPDKQLSDFGDYYSLVDIKTLLKKIKSHLLSQRKNISYGADFVKYLTDKYSGIYTPFCKFSDFTYQNEFRIVLLSNHFLNLDEKEPYITHPSLKNLSNVLLEHKPLSILLNAKNMKEL